MSALRPRSHKPKSRQPDGAPSLPTVVNGRESAGINNFPLRKYLFRICAGIFLPLFLLMILEMGLRLGGYGYSTDFFKPMRIGGQEMLVENDSFAFRFFPPDIARTPASLRIPMKKEPGTYRIFIMGESAALGDPEPAFGAGRYLEVLLRARFPNEKFEVVNVAMTAINSHAILPIARDCARQEGDLWILYLGNNEMVGPFGAATVFGAQAAPWPLVRLNLAIQQLRLGQLILEVGRKLRGIHSNRVSWTGMKMFEGNLVSPSDPRRQVVYQNFKRNLQDILHTGLHSGAQILLSTMAVNLKDCPPFESLISSNLAAMDRDRAGQWLAEGNMLAEQGNCAEAVRRYELASQLNPQSAELEYRLANCLLQSGNATVAREHFLKALDLDCLPFRADERINSLITEAGQQLASPRLALFDADAALGMYSADGIAGQENFYEHVHLNFQGNYRLARGWAEQITKLLPANFHEGAGSMRLSQELCEQWLGLSDWDRCNVLTEVCRRMDQPPLSNQFNNTQRRRSFSDQEARLRTEMNSTSAKQAHQVYIDALSKTPADCYLLENFANFLSDQDDLAGAIEQWQKVRALIPQDHTAYYELGRLAGRQGKFEEAESLLAGSVAIHPSFAPGWSELGKVYAASENYLPAVAAFEHALKYEPQDAQCWFDSGLALALLNRRAEAIEHYRQAINFDPNHWMAHYELGGLLGQDGKMAEAKLESEAAIRLNPDFPVAHLNLGLALVQLGQLDEAEHQFNETLRLEPTNSKAADYLNQARALRKRKL